MTEVVRAGADRLDELVPLWRALHAHHDEAAAGEWRLRPVEQSWQYRRGQYEEWLAGDAVLLIAEREGRAVGYLMLTFGPGAATWDVGERTAEIETMSVLPEERGSGTGAALMAAARDSARSGGAQSLLVGAFAANDGAVRFYEREGFRSFYVSLLTRL